MVLTIDTNIKIVGKKYDIDRKIFKKKYLYWYSNIDYKKYRVYVYCICIIISTYYNDSQLNQQFLLHNVDKKSLAIINMFSDVYLRN